MKTKIAIGFFVLMVLILIPLAVRAIYVGDTRNFALSLLAIVLAFIAVAGIARTNKRKPNHKK